MAVTVGNGGTIKATDENPAYLITDDYIIIDHVKYDLFDNKINYMGLVFELIDTNLVAYDDEGVANILALPVEENRIKDEEKIKELNNLVGFSNDKTRAIPSFTVNPPYDGEVSKGQWYAQTPAVNLPQNGFTVLTIFDTKEKIFTITGIYGDPFGGWYSWEPHKNFDISKMNYIKYLNFTIARYGIFTMGSLYGESGFSYTVSVTNKPI